MAKFGSAADRQADRQGLRCDKLREPDRWPLRPEVNPRCGLPLLLPSLTCLALSVDVLWRPLVSVAVVTQLVTHLLRARERAPGPWPS